MPFLLALNTPHSKKDSPGVRKGVGMINKSIPSVIHNMLGSHHLKSGQVPMSKSKDATTAIMETGGVCKKAMHDIAMKNPATFHRASRFFSLEVR